MKFFLVSLVVLFSLLVVDVVIFQQVCMFRMFFVFSFSFPFLESPVSRVSCYLVSSSRFPSRLKKFTVVKPHLVKNVQLAKNVLAHLVSYVFLCFFVCTLAFFSLFEDFPCPLLVFLGFFKLSLAYRLLKAVEQWCEFLKNIIDFFFRNHFISIFAAHKCFF